MKHPELILQIPEPCHEDWNKMSATDKGKFCHVCTKEVVDFSADSDETILKYFSKNGNICGRFHETQLNRKIIADRKKRHHWLSYAASLLLPMTLFSQETKSSEQKNPKTEQVAAPTYKSLNISSLDRKVTQNVTVQNDSITVQGTITDDTGLPLPGANVYQKGTYKGTTTDFDGHYKLTAQKGATLVISYIGYETKEVKISVSTIHVQLEVVDALEMLGAVVVATPNERYKSEYTCKTEEKLTEREQRTQNYFAFQRKKWLEKRAERRAKRTMRKAEKASKK
ncbi:TonB-dependent receptor SusC [Kordia sp. SMS9]|uniref:carboxypeptidase-like regulatory domain-containing protein n=1 Tax=Kordia sp. SMS9 TaxID=2282170 RepID=UPI000E0D1434|nr:carboxypeptidase-like regulatory domain-containing protein [Kordia sp. SMS9]AXG71032.1 TonB-dependent receptor SusC [Kordia sp. SMS9]